MPRKDSTPGALTAPSTSPLFVCSTGPARAAGVASNIRKTIAADSTQTPDFIPVSIVRREVSAWWIAALVLSRTCRGLFHPFQPLFDLCALYDIGADRLELLRAIGILEACHALIR